MSIRPPDRSLEIVPALAPSVLALAAPPVASVEGERLR
jgi:hypothetical protein